MIFPDDKSHQYIVIESKASNWGFRGTTGDEIQLNHKVSV